MTNKNAQPTSLLQFVDAYKPLWKIVLFAQNAYLEVHGCLLLCKGLLGIQRGLLCHLSSLRRAETDACKCRLLQELNGLTRLCFVDARHEGLLSCHGLHCCRLLVCLCLAAGQVALHAYELQCFVRHMPVAGVMYLLYVLAFG